MADAVVYGSYVLAGLVVLAYVLWVRWRWKAEKAQKAEKAAAAAAAFVSAPPQPAAPPPRSETGVVSPTPVRLPTQPPMAGAARTVAEAVQGITMPCDLAPLVDVPAITAAVDRVAFVTRSAPFEVVSAAVDQALQDIGYELAWSDEERAMARRDGNAVQVAVRRFPHSHGYLTAPETGVVVDLWIEAT